MTPVRTIRDLAAAVRGRRLEQGLSQARLAERAGISRQWLSEFENGKPTAELQLVLRVCDALGLELWVGDRSVRADGATGADLDELLREHGEP